MQIILSNQCESLTGKLNNRLGYHIEHRKHGFFVVRNSKGYIPPDGQWRFIVQCAQLAQSKLHIADIKVLPAELLCALYNAHHFVAADNVKDHMIYHARDILNLKTTFGL